MLSFRIYGFDFSVTTCYDLNFSEKWLHQSPEAPPVLTNTDTAYHDIPLAMYIVFDEYSRNYFGIADLSYSYKIIREDGSLFTDSSGIIAFTGIADTDTGVLLSVCSPEITFPRKEKTGTCQLIVTAEDRISGKKNTRKKKIVLARYPSPDPNRFDVISFNVWVHNYCSNPDPARAVAAFIWFMNSESSNNDRIFWPVFYFFQCLFHNNPVLVEKLMEVYPQNTARVKEYTVLLLRVIEVDRKKTWPITGMQWKKFDTMKETGFLDPFTITIKSKSVQFMELGFYYYGRYDMIRFLIGCLGANTAQGYEEFIGYCKKYDATLAETIDNETALQFNAYAGKILSTAYSKHQLIRMYCDYTLAYEHLSSDAKQALRAIVLGAGK